MKILMVNKFYYIKGGSETYYFALKKQLENEGHKVIDFSMNDTQNLSSPFSQYFVENIDYSGRGSISSKVKMAIKIIYSLEAKKKFEELIKKENPDLVHLHIFQHQLSPSILDVVKKYNIPTVYTAHDLKMICLNYKMMHHGKICEDCKKGKYYHCAKNRCVKDSFGKSCINVIEGYFHKWRKTYDAIDYVITPSFFYKEKFKDFGIASERIIHIPNFLNSENTKVNVCRESKKYYLYFGRLSEEKGVFTLIRAVEELNLLLYIVGTGPLKEEIERYVSEHKVEHIKILGFKSGQELNDLIGNAKAVILPSEWYENGPYSAIEALQMGRPIIGANIGGIPELIAGNGLLFDSGNSEDLREKINAMERVDDAKYSLLEKKSYRLYMKEYTWESHFEKLRKVYQMALVKKKRNKI